MIAFMKRICLYGVILFAWFIVLYLLSSLYSTYKFAKKNNLKFTKAITEVVWKPKLLEFIKWLVIDIRRRIINGKTFDEFGLTMYCGRQGDGKTVAMTEYLEWIRMEYPKAKIITNYYYKHETQSMSSWQDLITIRNGLDGVVFAIDEIQQEYNSLAWEDFPDDLLSEISYQRKQRVKIIGSSQVYGRVVKQLREQCFDVVECSTIGKRWTFQKCYDAHEYNLYLDNPAKVAMKLKPKWKKSFVQTDHFRDLFDTDAKAKRLEKLKMIPRNRRVQNAYL